VKAVLPFMGGVAYTSALWVLLTQTDKLILTKILTLKEYGYFALAIAVANGVTILHNPIGNAILPRMTFLLSQGSETDMINLYHKATQFVVVIIFPVVGVIALFSYPLLYSWTGNAIAAHAAAPVLTWYALGNGILAVGAFQYYLQYVHGKMRLHVFNTTINAVFQIPVFVFATLKYGAVGAAEAWFALRLISFFIWPPIVHHAFAPGIHRRWVLQDIMPPFLAVTAVFVAARWFFNDALFESSRIQGFSMLFAVWLLAFSVCIFAAGEVRKTCVGFVQRYVAG